MGRIPKKAAYWVGKRRKAGELQALRESLKKKSLMQSFRDILETALKKIDPVELAATLGATLIVHNFILDPVNNLLAAVQKAQTNFSWNATSPITQEIYGYVTGEKGPFDTAIWSMNEMQEWLISFTLAYIIIHNAGQIFGLLNTGLGPVLKLLLGVA